MVWKRAARDPLADIDPGAVGPARRADVADALSSRQRYAAIVDRTSPGPVRDRLEAVGEEVDSVVRAVYDAARRTDAREATLRDLDPAAITDRLKSVRRDLQRREEDGRPTDELRRMAESLDRQLGSVHAVWDAVERAASELHHAQLRLGEIVALAGAVAASVPDTATHELGGVRDELAALRAALEDLSG